MIADTFMRTVMSGLRLEATATAYAEWILGTDPRKRSTRYEEGVGRSWTVENILGSGPLVGDHGCRVEMRLSPERMLCRFIHRDTADGAIFWHTAARVTVDRGRVLVEHAVGRDAPRGRQMRPIASPSRVVLDLIERDGVEVHPRDLVLPEVLLQEETVERFVDHVLLRADRELPWLLVSPTRDGGRPLVDPTRLARSLRGICAVAVLASESATFAFSNVLEKRGYGDEFRCFNGALHTYGPTARLGDDHRIWLGDSLQAIGPDVRTMAVAGLLSHRLAIRDTPSGFFTLIEEHDRTERRDADRRLSERKSSPPPAFSGADGKQLEKETAELKAALKKSLEAEQQYLEAWNRADDERRQAEQEREDADARAEQERAVSAHLRESLQEAKLASGSAALTPGEVDAIQGVLAERITPLSCLVVLRLAYRDRIVVLDSALSSAEQARSFRHSMKLMGLLQTLATEYWEGLASGKGDSQASHAFTPKTFAATESETTKANRRAVSERTFSYRGRNLVMWRHIKIGAAETIAETIRVHFEWVAEEKKIVIGWCGEHRFRVD